MAAATASVADEDMPWVEKYRPRTLDDVVGNEDTVTRLKCIAKQGNMPNLIISGPPGSGKTTSILCLARELLGGSPGDVTYKNAVMELNASDDRGIDVVRNTIKIFAHKQVTLPPGRHKIIILDEADSMTVAAQQAMRRTMEVHSNTTRFALACNYSNDIIEPIQSRCAVLRFSRLTDMQITKRLREIINAENVSFTGDGIEALVFTADGDMRQAINNLHATFLGFGLVSQDNVFKVADQPHPTTVRAIINACTAMDLNVATDECVRLVWHGYTPSDIMSTMFRVLKSSSEWNEFLKLQFMRLLSESHAVTGADTASESPNPPPQTTTKTTSKSS
ncbi:replication factor C subunit 4 [Pelomyxa schiedti]|nr:replication factor C subunit 4 [Pelomyxa schiedti]